jgi:NAD(P)-dependent dehydrogenase (short-subunit alcohol dehydrogenase family)
MAPRAKGRSGPPPNPLDFTGKCIIVTGGTKGIGRVMATTFMEYGADVVVCARNPPAEPVSAAGKTAVFVACDVRDAEQCKAVAQAAVDQFGRIDVLVNNAGGAPPADSATVSPRFNERVVQLNLLAAMSFSQAVYPTMIDADDGGLIINISSISGERANPKGIAYGAAKAGLVNLARTLAVEWGPKIRVLTVTVGLIVTEEAHLYYGDEAGMQAVANTIPLRRMGTPEDIADAVLMLCSPLARWMTATNVHVDGGGEIPSYLSASTGDVTRVGN